MMGSSGPSTVDQGVIHAQAAQGRQEVFHGGDGAAVLPQGGGPGGVRDPGVMGFDLGAARQVGAHEAQPLVGPGRINGHRHRPAPMEADPRKF